MRRVGKHTNIVQLLGYCKREHPIMMIMEYVPCGDLVTISIFHELFLMTESQ